jgi:hypothetical protein
MLHGPAWDEPSFRQYKAAHPRPACQATYEVRGIWGRWVAVETLQHGCTPALMSLTVRLTSACMQSDGVLI